MPGDQFVEVEAMTPKDEAQPQKAEAPIVETPRAQDAAKPNRRRPPRRAWKPAARPSPADAMIVVPVRSVVLFPEIVFPITIGRPLSVEAAQAAVREQRQILVVLQKDPSVDAPGPDDLLSGRHGRQHPALRHRAGRRPPRDLPGRAALPDHRVRARPALPGRQGPAPARAQRRRLRHRGAVPCCCASRRWRCCELLPQAPAELRMAIEGMQSPAALADLAAAYMDIAPPEKQEILETVDLTARLDKVSRLLAHRLEVLKLSAEIGRQTKASLDDRQREVLLREQMAAIQKQLGEGDGNAAEIAELEKAIDDAGMPEEVLKQAKKELRRLQRMPDASAEYGMIRTYLDWLIELPWKDAAAADDRHRRGAQDPRRRPLRPGEDQDPHHRVPGGAQAGARGQGADPVLRRPARRRQDLARPVDRPGARPPVRAHQPRRRARRGRDPRPPAHLHRRAARQHHPGDPQGRLARLR